MAAPIPATGARPVTRPVRPRRTMATRWWGLLRMSVTAAWAVALLVMAGGAAFWGLGALPRLATVRQQITQAERLDARLPHTSTSTATVLKQRIQATKAAYAALQQSIPAQVTSLQATDAIFAWAQHSGVAVQSLSVGAPSTVQGLTTLPVTVGLQAPSSPALIAFLTAVNQSAVPASVSVTSLSLASGPQTLSVTVNFHSRGAG